MKKLLAILLALMLVMVSVAALAGSTPEDNPEDPPVAENGDSGEDSGGSDAATTTDLSEYIETADPSVDTETGMPANEEHEITIPKVINLKVYNEPAEGATKVDKHPAFELTFGEVTKTVSLSTVEHDDIPDITLPDAVSIAEGANTADITIGLPKYTVVGIYEYTFKENVLGYAGLTQEAGDLKLKVTVVQEADGLYIEGIAFRQNDVKTDELDDLYEAGSLTVSKSVSGNMGDRTKKFPITVTFSSEKPVKSSSTYTQGSTTTDITWTNDKSFTVTLMLKHGDSVQFDNIPAGVTYMVVEDDETKTDGIKHLDDSKDEQTDANAYLVGGEVDEATEITVAKNTPVEITNQKDIDIDTGVSVDSAVYMLIMALALAGFVALKIRRREEN